MRQKPPIVAACFMPIRLGFGVPVNYSIVVTFTLTLS